MTPEPGRFIAEPIDDPRASNPPAMRYPHDRSCPNHLDVPSEDGIVDKNAR